MKRIHPLPSMLTLGNFGCGFVAIILAARSLLPETRAIVLPLTQQQANLFYLSCSCIFLAMLFDMLDGKVARMTGSACKFGGELDSLADIVSFGIAPAAIISLSWIRVEPQSAHWWSSVLGCGFIYASCACIRLARYNVEMDTKAKDYFRGLPSPAAGGAAASMFMLVHDDLLQPYILSIISATVLYRLMAGYLLIMGLLMVTRVRYAHISNRFLGGRKRLTHLVLMLFSLALFINYPVYLLSLLFNCYALWGLFGELVRRIRLTMRYLPQVDAIKTNVATKPDNPEEAGTTGSAATSTPDANSKQDKL